MVYTWQGEQGAGEKKQNHSSCSQLRSSSAFLGKTFHPYPNSIGPRLDNCREELSAQGAGVDILEDGKFFIIGEDAVATEAKLSKGEPIG